MATKAYRLRVDLVSGPAEFRGSVSSEILIRADARLVRLHEAIFKAFERHENHLWYFEITSPNAESQYQKVKSRKFGPPPREPDPFNIAGDATAFRIDAFGLRPGETFQYVFDMGDFWKHSIEVLGVEDCNRRMPAFEVVKRPLEAPPQHPGILDDDEEEEDES